VQESAELLRHAADLAGRGLALEDALHLSCAAQGGCQCFLTTDLGIWRKKEQIPELAVMNPMEYVAKFTGTFYED